MEQKSLFSVISPIMVGPSSSHTAGAVRLGLMARNIYKNEFKKHVIDDFINCYANCKTPNPCIECNKYLKFGFM